MSNLENSQTYCPRCHAKIIKDVWEEITELPDGTFQQEIIDPAFVCSKFCGYYERGKFY